MTRQSVESWAGESASDPGLTIVHPNAGGIDLGNESHFVAVPSDRDANSVRGFGCWTAALHEMAGWMKSCRIDTVAMEATGVHRIALYDGLEQPRHLGRAGERRRLTELEFDGAYRRAKRAVFGQAIARRRQGTGAAAAVTLKRMVDTGVPASTRRRAAELSKQER